MRRLSEWSNGISTGPLPLTAADPLWSPIYLSQTRDEGVSATGLMTNSSSQRASLEICHLALWFKDVQILHHKAMQTLEILQH